MRGFECLGTRLDELDRPFAKTGGGWHAINYRGVKRAVDEVRKGGSDAVTVFITGQVQGDAESGVGSSRYRVLLSDVPGKSNPTHDAFLSGDAEPPTDGKTWLSIPGLLQYLSNAGMSNADIVLFTDNAGMALDDLDEEARARVTCLTGREEKADGEVYDGFAQRLMCQIRRAGETDGGVGSSADPEDEGEAGKGGEESTAVKKYLNSLDGDTVRTEYELARLASRPWP
jgi:hypothetical protein